MALPPASESDVTTLDSQVRVIVHSFHVFDVTRVDGNPVKYRVSLLAPVETSFSAFNVPFPRKQWEFPDPAAAVNFARTTALVIYNQYKAIDDAVAVIRSL